MGLLLTILSGCLVVGLLTVAAAGTFLLLPAALRQRLQPHLISLATGTLLGAAFIALLPHALVMQPNEQATHQVTLTVLLGLLFLFVLEKLALWRHCHAEHCEAHDTDVAQVTAGLSGPLVLLGDSIHNLLHGILIAAAFVAEFHLGVVTVLAISAHQVPQQLANFAVLLHGGFNRRKAFFYNALSSISALIGGIVGYLGLSVFSQSLPYMLAIAVASCIYIAVGDLIPGLHKRTDPRASIAQIIMIALGVMTIYWAHGLLH